MSVERQEETNLAQLGRVAMWIETARWSDAELTVVTQEYRPPDVRLWGIER
ncbi:hypothetical protein B0H14DRAFT_3455268 [Mycena olivaceomarginata]|nr:hypothetical protein B0H14DRAFT_3455268 [Mycena olivaceomarginata]